MKRTCPFQNLSTHGRINLARFAVLVFYLFQVGLALYSDSLFNTIGSDFISFWSVGRIANTEGYGRIYDLSLLSEIQKPFHETVATDNVYAPIPTPFFAIFILPLQILAWFDPRIGFGFWTILNLAGLIFYLRFFIGELTPVTQRSDALFILLYSLPVFQTLYWGQVNVWMVICIGEFMRTAIRGKSIQSGAWLAGLMIKPQTLVVLIPVLLLQRDWKKLTGFSMGAFVIFGGSLALAGVEGLKSLFSLWLNYASGIPTNAPENMINWRMVALQFSNFAPPSVAWTIGMAGLAATLLAGVLPWFKPISPALPGFPLRVLGVLAATTSIAWHSHVHLAIIILPALVCLAAQNQIPHRLVHAWVFLPPLVYVIAFSFSGLAAIAVLPRFGYEGLFLGVCELALQLSLLMWAARGSMETA